MAAAQGQQFCMVGVSTKFARHSGPWFQKCRACKQTYFPNTSVAQNCTLLAISQINICKNPGVHSVPGVRMRVGVCGGANVFWTYRKSWLLLPGEILHHLVGVPPLTRRFNIGKGASGKTSPGHMTNLPILNLGVARGPKVFLWCRI